MSKFIHSFTRNVLNGTWASLRLYTSIEAVAIESQQVHFWKFPGYSFTDLGKNCFIDLNVVPATSEDIICGSSEIYRKWLIKFS